MKTTGRTRTTLRLCGLGAGVAAFLVFLALERLPVFTERLYGEGLGPAIASILSRATGWIPLSVAEILAALFVIRQVRGASWGITMIRLRERKAGAALASGLLRLGSDLGILVALGYALWGFNYARPPIEERYGWRCDGADVEELTVLALDMVDAANEEYLALMGSKDAGVPTSDLLGRIGIAGAIDKGWQEAARVMGEPALARPYGPPKPLLSSRLFDYMWISGIYTPWTGEANYNRDAPAESLPHVFAHEMAHQRGYAREDEANFMGFLAAALSPHPYPRYSAAIFAQRQLIAAVGLQDRDRARGLVARRLPGVKRDIEAADAYWARFAGPTQHVAERVNDAYLKSQGVPGGIRSYARSVQLLVGFARSHQSALPRGGVAPG